MSSSLEFPYKHVTFADFNFVSNKLTLRFKDPALEAEYYQKRVDPLRIIALFKIIFFILAAFLAVRRIEVLIFALYEVSSGAGIVLAEALNVGFLGAVLILEGIIFYVQRLNLFRGLFFMTYIFFSISYASYASNPYDLLSVPAQFFFKNKGQRDSRIYVRLCRGSHICHFLDYIGCSMFYRHSIPVGFQSTFLCALAYSFVQFTSCIDEVVFADAVYFVAYGLLVTFFYATEFKIRYDFFLAYKQEEFQKGYRRLLTDMPVGLILFDERNKEPVFCNKVITTLVTARYCNAGDNQAEHTGGPDSARVTKENIINAVGGFVQSNGDETLKEILDNWDSDSLDDNHKYVYRVGESESTYTIKGLKTVFQSVQCKALILQDQTAFEELARLEEKYQKFYVASIVHDIRTPLNGVMGMLEIIASATNNPRLNVLLEVAKKICKLLLFLTYDITDYSQLEAKKFKPNNTSVDLRETLEEVSHLLSFNLNKKRLGSSFACRESIPSHVYIDKNRYIQILLNLVGNAIKFTFEGSVDVEVEYDSENDYLITSVKDTGVGIPPEEIPNLFKLFGKLESNSNVNPQGVGFGLAMCKKLSEALGGYITVKSAVGIGSTFTFAIKGNCGLQEERKTFSEASKLNTFSQEFITLEIPAKLEKHTFKVRKSKGDLERQRMSITSRHTYSARPHKAIEEDMEELPKGTCECKDLLIVDDNGYNLFVLQGYLQMANLEGDEVLLLMHQGYNRH
eukprot:TRINITY_DN3244_c0_g1_i1.p1 TRINITY_DN3244_c0_g1~~TRINITY_DN3244_c0_g1_i1.p1  ORF type:complete len:739 (-),score=48.90 TRINITY_DN3244_c0_g1_i1:433-2649(-)